MNFWKRFCACCIVCVMTITLLPVTAHATSSEPTYEVRFDAKGGNDAGDRYMEPQTISYGATVKLKANTFEAPDTMIFIGWAETNTASQPKYVDGQPVKDLADPSQESITLYAIWAESLDTFVSYLIDEESAGRGTIDVSNDYWNRSSGVNPGGSTAAANEGYIFLGWKDAEGNFITDSNEDVELIGNKIRPLIVSSKNTYYTAVFGIPNAMYTVNYYKEDDDGNYSLWTSSESGAPVGSTVTAPSKDPGAKYFQDPDAPGACESGIVLLDNSLVLSVYYSINRYSVTWNNMDGTEIYTEDNVLYGTTPAYTGEEPVPDPMEHYLLRFTGWTPTIAPVTANVIYTAVFEQTPESYTVSFNTQGGSAVTNQIVRYGEKAERPSDPVREGYVFDDWYTNDQLNETFDFAAMTIDRDTTIFAKWTKEVHLHNLEKVTGQAPTETASGWKDYYECKNSEDACGAWFEDDEGTTPITDLTAWKAEGGKGYLAPLTHTHTMTPAEGLSPTEKAAGYKPYYECTSCGKFFEDAEGTTPITDLTAWKAEGGKGYLAPLPAPADFTVEYAGETIEDAKTDVRKITVEGLDKIAAKETESGNTVTIKLTVEPQKDAVTAEQKELKNLAGESKKIEFLELTLLKQASGGTPVDIGGENALVLNIDIPFDFSKVLQSSITVYRYHDSAETLKKDPGEGEEGFVVDQANGKIIIKAHKFSTYAIGYEETTTPPTGDNTHMTIWIVMFVLSSVIAAACVAWEKKRKQAR